MGSGDWEVWLHAVCWSSLATGSKGKRKGVKQNASSFWSLYFFLSFSMHTRPDITVMVEVTGHKTPTYLLTMHRSAILVKNIKEASPLIWSRIVAAQQALLMKKLWISYAVPFVIQWLVCIKEVVMLAALHCGPKDWKKKKKWKDREEEAKSHLLVTYQWSLYMKFDCLSQNMHQNSSWDNRNGWLGTKHQVTYLHTKIITQTVKQRKQPTNWN